MGQIKINFEIGIKNLTLAIFNQPAKFQLK